MEDCDHGRRGSLQAGMANVSRLMRIRPIREIPAAGRNAVKPQTTLVDRHDKRRPDHGKMRIFASGSISA